MSRRDVVAGPRHARLPTQRGGVSRVPRRESQLAPGRGREGRAARAGRGTRDAGRARTVVSKRVWERAGEVKVCH